MTYAVAAVQPWTAFNYFYFIYKLRKQCHTITAETVQNSNRHWRRPTQVLKHSGVATNHVLFSKCNRMHPSDSGCSLHTGVCRLQQPACRLQQPAYERSASCCILHTGVMQDALRRHAGFIRSYAACIRAYEGCVRSYCSLHAGTHAACMPP